jgi:hypothetical protein
MALERIAIQEEVYDFLAGPNSEQIVAFRPSESAQERMRYLLSTNREGALTLEERDELDDNIRLEDMMRVLKAKARQYVK